MGNQVGGIMGAVVFMWILTVLISVVLIRWIFKINRIVDELRIIRRLVQVDLEESRPELKEAIQKEIKEIQLK